MLLVSAWFSFRPVEREEKKKSLDDCAWVALSLTSNKKLLKFSVFDELATRQDCIDFFSHVSWFIIKQFVLLTMKWPTIHWFHLLFELSINSMTISSTSLLLLLFVNNSNEHTSCCISNTLIRWPLFVSYHLYYQIVASESELSLSFIHEQSRKSCVTVWS